MKYLLIFTLGLFLVACSSEKEDIIDINDILPKSERNYDKKDSVVHENSDSLKMYQGRFEVLGTLDSISIYDEDFFPDRVGPKKTEKYRLTINDEEIVFVKWRFSDSLRVSNALFNWSDCFGPKCKSIRIGEEKNLQRKAFQVLANDSVLIYLESDTQLDIRKWDNYFDQQGYDLDWNYRLEQSRSGRVRWFNYLDEKKTPLKNNAL
ncbi:MAG: hypothetical protein HRT58_07520 [Crocinitomicaceae bacterium]|nr:hypothetical protein [Flavobacteriales bacterium]NQZ35498.1 hypothetical protein [Crocinitomicaceae bacterium]